MMMITRTNASPARPSRMSIALHGDGLDRLLLRVRTVTWLHYGLLLPEGARL